MDTKCCSRCGEQLPLDMFSRSYTSKDSYTICCKKCYAEKKSLTFPPKETWPEGFRACTKCNEIKVLEEFYTDPKGRFGRMSVCMKCRSKAKPKPQAKEGYRFCTKCGEEKPATPEYFPIQKKNRSGIDSRCHICASKASQRWYEKKKIEDPDYSKRIYWKDVEKSRQQNRTYYSRNIVQHRANSVRKYYENIEESRRKNREDYYRHREDRKEKSRKWRQANPERYRDYNRQWTENNPETHKSMQQAKDQRRRARKRNLPSNFTLGDWQYCLEYWGSKCAVCGSHENLHADHWIALSKEGTLGTVPENMIVLCSHCNRTKHATESKVWLIRKLGEEAGLAKLAEIEAYFQHLRERKPNSES
jgi:5-methylcytosine-specific restriction endonuclease McrA